MRVTYIVHMYVLGKTYSCRKTIYIYYDETAPRL